MSMSSKSTRDLIVETADRLFYQNGYEHTSFTAIADELGISRGNFYYHFKSKDEILGAVITLRLVNIQQMLERWEQAGDSPAERIRSFVHILIANQQPIMLYGCPVGTLCSELAKLRHASQTEANKLFTLLRLWLGRQFAALGFDADADAFAMHLLVRSQGVATLASVFHDEALIRREVDYVNDWLKTRLAGAPARG